MNERGGQGLKMLNLHASWCSLTAFPTPLLDFAQQWKVCFRWCAFVLRVLLLCQLCGELPTLWPNSNGWIMAIVCGFRNHVIVKGCGGCLRGFVGWLLSFFKRTSCDDGNTKKERQTLTMINLHVPEDAPRSAWYFHHVDWQRFLICHSEHFVPQFSVFPTSPYFAWFHRHGPVGVERLSLRFLTLRCVTKPIPRLSTLLLISL